MNAESPRTTVDRFSKTWNQTDTKSLIAEFVSISKETNREPDSYHFIVKDGLLLDPNTKKPILNFIAEGIEKDVARSLTEWATKNNEGMALWVSPSKENVYPCPKLIIHQIAYDTSGEKVVLNSAIIFDGEILNPEYKRSRLYHLPDSNINIQKILKWVKGRTKNNTVKNMNNNTEEKAQYFAELLGSGVSKQFVIQEMVNSGFIGQNPISCPRRVFEQISYAGLVFGNSRTFSVTSEKKGWSYGPGHCRICDKDRKQVGPCKICKECEKNF